MESLFGTALHELTHWTAAPSRCNRDLGNRFGTEAYAFEELTAELGSAFLCAELGVTPEVREDPAAYLASWLKGLKLEKRAIQRGIADWPIFYTRKQSRAEKCRIRPAHPIRYSCSIPTSSN